MDSGLRRNDEVVSEKLFTGFSGSAGRQPRNGGGRVMAAVAGLAPRAPRDGSESHG
jgi:hypothetical protein